MKLYEVTLPVTGTITVRLRAEDEASAIDQAENWWTYDEYPDDIEIENDTEVHAPDVEARVIDETKGD